ncbi:hypothetical protein T459_14864 [Capsicum annuum]|uniref:Ubiquitin-like protease family profile domain-containing protein n=1 Tax=Capsicum annuum TaxID=4072 RepID=A0A2G2ZIM1_CAPAN|nr:hypothetical protein T459_14864 [Capsicum annuum]
MKGGSVLHLVEVDPDWEENQSNHRNDPVTMKKLRDKAASKSKKSPSKASKKKFDDSDRPHLPKFAEKMAELITLISKIPIEVVKALKNEENKQSQDVNAADKEAGREDDFKNEDCSDLQALEDEIMAYEEECSNEELGKKNIPDVENLSNVNVTAKEDVNEVNLKNQESTDVTDVQDEVGGTVTDSIQAAVDKILFDLSTPSTTKSLDVGASNKITERHWDLRPVRFHLTFLMLRYMTINSFFKTYVEKTHTRYYPAEPAVEISTQQDYAKSIMVAKNEDDIANIIHGFCMLAGLPWYMVDEVYVSINYGKEFHWVLAVIVLKERLIRVYDSLSTYKGKITQQTGLVNEIPFDVDYVQNIPQQASYSLDCGIFVCAYAEILSEGLQVHSCGFDAASQRACYASLLWHYEVKKANEGYTSDNGDPPRPRKNIIEEIDASAIVTLE